MHFSELYLIIKYFWNQKFSVPNDNRLWQAFVGIFYLNLFFLWSKTSTATLRGVKHLTGIQKHPQFASNSPFPAYFQFHPYINFLITNKLSQFAFALGGAFSYSSQWSFGLKKYLSMLWGLPQITFLLKNVFFFLRHKWYYSALHFRCRVAELSLF